MHADSTLHDLETEYGQHEGEDTSQLTTGISNIGCDKYHLRKHTVSKAPSLSLFDHVTYTQTELIRMRSVAAGGEACPVLLVYANTEKSESRHIANCNPFSFMRFSEFVELEPCPMQEILL